MSKSLALLMTVAFCLLVAAGHVLEDHEQAVSFPRRSTGSVRSTDESLLRSVGMDTQGSTSGTSDSNLDCSSLPSGTSAPSKNAKCSQQGRQGIIRRSTAANEDDGTLEVSQPSIPANTMPDKTSRLRRRGGRRSKYTNEQLRDMGLTEEQITRYRSGQKEHNAYSYAVRANSKARKAGEAPRFSPGELKQHRPGATDYEKLRELIEAIKSGDEAQIAKARRVAAVEYEPRVISDAELKKVFHTDADVQHFKNLRSAYTEWSRMVETAKQAGLPLKDEDLTPDQRRLQAEAAEYKHLGYVSRQTRAQPLPIPVMRGVAKFKDGELKKWLDLESLADFNKGRRLATEYGAEMTRRRKAAKPKPAKPKGVELKGDRFGSMSTPPNVPQVPEVSEVELSRLRRGKRLYVDMLEVYHLAKEAASKAQPGQDGLVTSDSVRLGGQKRLFTIEEENIAKRLFSVDEIEEYVEGRRAEDELKKAKATIEAAPPEARSRLAAQWNFEELRRQANRYKELHPKVVEEERKQQGHQPRAGSGRSLPGASTEGSESAEQQKNGDGKGSGPQQAPAQADVASVSINQQQEHQQQQVAGYRRPRQKIQKHSDNPSAANTLPFSTNPSFYVDQVKAGWKELNGRLQHSLRANGPYSSLRPMEVIPAIGSSARNAFRPSTRLAIPLRV